jgi:hypothetical protein
MHMSCMLVAESMFTYHSLLSEAADLLDRPGSPLLEADTVDLYPNVLALCSASVFRPIPAGSLRREHSSLREQSAGHRCQRDRSARVPPLRLCKPSLDFTKLNQHTRLCRWIVYSRATTSAMALRWVLPAGFLVFAEGAIVCGEVLSWCSMNGSCRHPNASMCLSHYV